MGREAGPCATRDEQPREEGCDSKEVGNKTLAAVVATPMGKMIDRLYKSGNDPQDHRQKSEDRKKNT